MTDWAALVPSHDETFFRQSLLAYRHRRGFPGRKGFYCPNPNEQDEEDEWREAERAAAVAAFEVCMYA